MADDVFDVFAMSGGKRVVVGAAVKNGDGFDLHIRDMTMAPAAARAAPASCGAVFPPYGRSKGQPVAGASAQDLDFYAAGCERTLGDTSKARWHEKELALLDAIRAEQKRQAGGAAPTAAPASKPADDGDLPF